MISQIKKMSTGLLLMLISTLTYATIPSLPEEVFQKTGRPQTNVNMSPPMVISNNTYIQSSLGLVPVKNIQEKDIPEVVMPWVNWIKAKNPKDNCIIDNNNEKICIFAPSITIEESSDSFIFTIMGSSYVNDFWLNLPSNVKVNKLNISVNGVKPLMLEKNGMDMVQVSSGDFTVKFNISKNELLNNPSLVLPENFLIIKNKTSQNISTENQQLSFLSQKEILDNNSNQQKTQEVKVYRKLIDSIPLRLETRIKVVYAGNEKEIYLGKVVPENFYLTSINSPLSINEKEDGFYVRVVSGEHWITFNTYSTKNVTKINIEKLVPEINQEYWSIQNNPNLRQFEIRGVDSLDPNQAFYPKEWHGFSAYLVKNNIEIHTLRRGLNVEDKLSIGVNRVSWFGFNEDKLLNLDSINMNNNGKTWIEFNKTITPKEFSINNNPQMIVKNGEKEGIIVPQGNYPSQLFSQSDLKFENKMIVDSQQQIQSWNLNLAPRHRLLYVSGVDRAINSWYDNWNLYTVFAIFLISLGFYKLFGLPLALLSFSSIFLFQSVPFLAWTIWPILLLFMALLKVLPLNNGFSKLVRVFSVVLVISVSLVFINFTVKEFRYTINGSLEKTDSIQANVFSGAENIGLSTAMVPAAPAPAPIAEMMQDSANIANSAPMLNKAISANTEKKERNSFYRDIKSVESQKVQVATGTPVWYGNEYPIITSKSSEVEFYIAKPWLVNMGALLQIFNLFLVVIFLCMYVLNMYEKTNILENIIGYSRLRKIFNKFLGVK